MSEQDYPEWIDEYAKAFHNAFVNMMPCSWGPVDAFALVAFLNGSFLLKVYKAVKKFKQENYSLDEIAKSFATLSSLRVQSYWLALEYQNSQERNKKQ